MNYYHLKRNSATGDLLDKWLKEGWYRIVKYDVPDMAWYLVQVGWFGSVYGVPGSDRGAPGEYNYQLIRANNPATLIDDLVEIAQFYLTPTRIKKRGRDKLPRTPIIDEINVLGTVQAFRIYLRDNPAASIAELNQLVRRKGEPTPV